MHKNVSTGPTNVSDPLVTAAQQSVQRICFGYMKLIEYVTSLVHLIQVFMCESYSLEI